MLKLLSLFSGIGAFEKALQNLGVPFELVAFCEFDKYAVKSYCAIHGVDESKNLGDITKVDETKLPKDIDVLTYGFPCQDISLAGKQKGLFNEDGTQTRSGLFFEALRIIEATKPKIAIAENVKNLVSKKFNAQFQIVLASLEAAGYNNYYQVLNAKDYGVPQNRQRVFIVSIRKDIDNGLFRFPKPFPLDKRLKDVLEDDVDEKYYLSDKGVNFVLSPKRGMTTDINPAVIQPLTAKGQNNWTGSFISPDIETLEKSSEIGGKSPVKIVMKDGNILVKEADSAEIIQVAQMYPNSGNPQAGRIYDSKGISPTMDTCSGGNRMPKVVVVGKINSSQDGVVVSAEGIAPTHTAGHGNTPKILVREATKTGYAEAYEGDSINLEQPNSKTRRGRVGKQVAQTLTTSCNQAVVVSADE